jgi:hypothetical protein
MAKRFSDYPKGYLFSKKQLVHRLRIDVDFNFNISSITLIRLNLPVVIMDDYEYACFIYMIKNRTDDCNSYYYIKKTLNQFYLYFLRWIINNYCSINEDGKPSLKLRDTFDHLTTITGVRTGYDNNYRTLFADLLINEFPSWIRAEKLKKLKINLKK